MKPDISDKQHAKNLRTAGLITEHEYLTRLGYDDPDSELERREKLRMSLQVIDGQLAELITTLVTAPTWSNQRSKLISQAMLVLESVRVLEADPE